jgi:hypothetical protein
MERGWLMRWRHRIRIYQKPIGTAFAALGVLVWATSAVLHFGPHNDLDVSISHFEVRSLGVIAGGASVIGGIILLATAV